MHRKIPVMEYLFTKVPGLKACDLIKNKTPTQVFFCEYCEIFKNIHFEEHLRTAASERFACLIQDLKRLKALFSIQLLCF